MNTINSHSGSDNALVPFSIQVEPIDRMLNFEIADDSAYQGVEIQGFDDQIHGQGIAVLLARRADETVDVYFEAGLRLDPMSYAIGAGLGAWVETSFEVAKLTISAELVDAELRFVDRDGREIEIRVGDRTRRSHLAHFLAPMGAAITEPSALPLAWMSWFDLLRRTDTAQVIRIGGDLVSPGRLPLEWLHRHRLIKVASDICTVWVNRVNDHPTPLTATATFGEVVTGPDGVAAITDTGGGHEAALRFDPPFPALQGSSDPSVGGWELTIDNTRIVAGEWTMSPGESGLRLGFAVTTGWRPRGLPLLMKVVTRAVPVFRRWPTTYRWTAKATLDDPPMMVSQWTRTGTDRGESYRSLTGTD